MEEQQIKDLVHRISSDEILRQEVARDPQVFIEREGFSPTLARIVMKLIPHLTLTDDSFKDAPWWS